MDNLSLFLFAIAGISLTVGSFYLIFSAFASKEVRDYNAGKIPLPKQKVTCEIEDYDELQRRINKLKSWRIWKDQIFHLVNMNLLTKRRMMMKKVV